MRKMTEEGEVSRLQLLAVRDLLNMLVSLLLQCYHSMSTNFIAESMEKMMMTTLH